jgi:hypothetical protein
MKRPFRISYNCSNHNHPCFKSIEVNGVAVHQVMDVNEFYEALGYTDEVQREVVLPDEFIWDEYFRNGSDRSVACLDVKLIEYLMTNSEKFVEMFGREVEDRVLNCHGDVVAGSDCRAACSFVQGRPQAGL